MNPDQLRRYLASPLSKFRPWVLDGNSPQRDFVKAAAKHRTRVFRGGNRSGKTTLGGFDLALHLCGWHPYTKFTGPVHWWASAVSFRDGIGAVLWPALKQFLPASEIRSIAWYQKSEPETPTSLVMKNGSTVVFKSVEQTRVKYQGARLHGIWIDEEHPPDIIEECRMRLLDFAGYLSVTLTPIRRERWVSRLEKEAGTFSVQASTLDAAKAGTVDLEATLQIAANMPERQRRVRIEGDHVALQGAVWPEFTRGTHELVVREGRLWLGEDSMFPWPIPKSWRRFSAIDFGFNNPTAICLAAEDPFHERLIVYRVYYSSGVRASEWGWRMKETLPELASIPWADHDSFARAEFEHEGVPTQAAKKSDVNAGLEAVSRMLVRKCGDDHPALLFVTDPEALDPFFGLCDTKVLQEEIDNYHYRQHKEGSADPKDEPVKENDHACDSLRYMITGYEAARGGPPLPPGALDEPWRQDNALTLAWPDGGEDE